MSKKTSPGKPRVPTVSSLGFKKSKINSSLLKDKSNKTTNKPSVPSFRSAFGGSKTISKFNSKPGVPSKKPGIPSFKGLKKKINSKASKENKNTADSTS